MIWSLLLVPIVCLCFLALIFHTTFQIHVHLLFPWGLRNQENPITIAKGNVILYFPLFPGTIPCPGGTASDTRSGTSFPSILNTFFETRTSTLPLQRIHSQQHSPMKRRHHIGLDMELHAINHQHKFSNCIYFAASSDSQGGYLFDGYGG